MEGEIYLQDHSGTRQNPFHSRGLFPCEPSLVTPGIQCPYRTEEIWVMAYSLISLIQLKGSSQVFDISEVITSRSQTRNYLQLGYALNASYGISEEKEQVVTLHPPTASTIAPPPFLYSILLYCSL